MSLLKRMGFGQGKLEIGLYDSTFGFGDRIQGELVLILDEPMEASGLDVGLYATQRELRSEYDYTDKRHEDRWTTTTLFRDEIRLDGPHKYDAGRYPFELLTPGRVAEGSNAPPAESILGAMFRSRDRFGPVEWSIRASLDLPWSVDLKAEVGIHVLQHQSYNSRRRSYRQTPQPVVHTVPLPAPVPSPQNGPKFCRFCGSPFRPDARFCESCGKPRGE